MLCAPWAIGDCLLFRFIYPRMYTISSRTLDLVLAVKLTTQMCARAPYRMWNDYNYMCRNTVMTQSKELNADLKQEHK